MKSGKLSKMATVLAILVLVMSGLMVAQWNAQPVEASEHQDYRYTIEGFLDTDGVIIESDLEIKLKSLSTGEPSVEEATSDYYYEFTNVEPGWYQIIFPSQVEDNIAYMRNATETFRVPAQDDGIPSNININATEIDDTLEGQITDEAGYPVEDALVTLENENFEHSVYTEMVTQDNETLSTYEIGIYNGFEGTLKVEKEGYAPYMNTTFSFQAFDEDYYNVTLNKRPVIEGNLVDQSGNGIKKEMDITIYNEQTGILHTTKQGPTFRIRAPVDYDFTLVVSAPGFEPLVEEITPLNQGEIRFIGTKAVSETGSEQFQTDINFDHGSDLNEIQVDTSRQLQASTRFETLNHDYLGHLTMQIDRTLGDNNVEEFKKRLNYTRDIQYTSEYITVNDTVYQLENYEAQFSEGFEDNLTGSMTDLFEETLYFNTTRTYTAVENIETGRHIVDLTVQNNRTDGNFRERSYSVDLIETSSTYERYMGPGTQEVVPNNVDVQGYTELDIYPGENGLDSQLTLDIRESKDGNVDLVVNNIFKPSIFEKEEGEEYIVKGGTEVEFEAKHENPVSQPTDYNWNVPGQYEDDDDDPSIRSVTFEEGDTGNVSVTITESSGDTVFDELSIVVDVEGPHGDILVDDEAYSHEDMVTVNEDEEIEFSGDELTDNKTEAVSQYRWNFSDESPIQEGMNITHVFETPDDYDLTLNVTDAVGNANKIKLDLDVADTTEPVGNFTIEWDDQVRQEPLVSIVRGTNVTFNGTDIEAHPDYEGELTFNWTLINEEENVTEASSEEDKWTYSDFTEAGEYTIRMNVTDGSGNSREDKKTLIIERGPVPDLLVSDLRFSKDDPRVGDTVTISVNVTNVGEVNATDVSVSVKVDGELVNVEEEFYKDGEELNNSIVESGEEVKLKMEWEFENDGENTVNVNITDGEEPQEVQFDNEIEDSIDVRQAAWREYLVYALIPIIIIGVAAGLYMFRDKLR